jgi:hypothetical protein
VDNGKDHVDTIAQGLRRWPCGLEGYQTGLARIGAREHLIASRHAAGEERGGWGCHPGTLPADPNGYSFVPIGVDGLDEGAGGFDRHFVLARTATVNNCHTLSFLEQEVLRGETGDLTFFGRM